MKSQSKIVVSPSNIRIPTEDCDVFFGEFIVMVQKNLVGNFLCMWLRCMATFRRLSLGNILVVNGGFNLGSDFEGL